MNYSCPVDYTCESINDAILNFETLKVEIDELYDSMEKHPWDFSNKDEYRKYLYELKDAVNTLTKLTYFKSDLEHLRSENSTLRKWGVEMSERCQELEKEIESRDKDLDHFEDKISDLKNEVEKYDDELSYAIAENDDLKEEIDSLKDQIYDLERDIQSYK